MLHRSRREKIHVRANPGGRPTQLHALLLELIPGGANKDLPAAQAKKLVATVRPRDAVSKTRRRVAAEMIGDLEKIYARSKAADKGLTALIAATTTTLQALHGIGPSGTARLLVDLHIMAVVQLRNQTEGRAQFDRRVAEGKTPMEAMRALKRRLSDIVYKQMKDDAQRVGASPGGHPGTTHDPGLVERHSRVRINGGDPTAEGRIGQDHDAPMSGPLDRYGCERLHSKTSVRR